jgi:hypothetical protein
MPCVYLYFYFPLLLLLCFYQCVFSKEDENNIFYEPMKPDGSFTSFWWLVSHDVHTSEALFTVG